jgi:hypothetical protein
MSAVTPSAVASLPSNYVPPGKSEPLPSIVQTLRQKAHQLGNKELLDLVDQLEKTWTNERADERRLRVGLYRLLFPKSTWDNFDPADYHPVTLDEVLAGSSAKRS